MNRPNRWGVTLDTTDERIVADLKNWDWGWNTGNDAADAILNASAIRAATIVMREIRNQTMADIEDDGTVCVGLFEFEATLKVSLADLVDDWIDHRMNHREQKLGSSEGPGAAKLASILEALAKKLRSLQLDD